MNEEMFYGRVTEEFLGILQIMDVMEDWGSRKPSIAAWILKKIRKSSPDEASILVRALHIIYPDLFFLYKCDHLLIRTKDFRHMKNFLVQNASYVEEVKDGELQVVKYRDSEHGKQFGEWLKDAIDQSTRLHKPRDLL